VSESANIHELLRIPPRDAMHKLANMPNHLFKPLASQLLNIQKQQRQENQLLYYRPVSDIAEKVHLTNASTVGVFGGNGSGKTETCLVEMMMVATGIVPHSLRDKIDIEKKYRGPVNCRVVCESLTTVLHPIIIPKLQWWTWTGVDRPGGDRGHWGHVPRSHLIGGSWERSWSEKLRTLRVLYKNPLTGEYEGDSKIQFMSVDQDPSDFASGDYHMILHDEPPNLAIWRENEARTMRVDGRMFLAMTWPDDPAIAVDWIYDEVYEPGNQGSDVIECINIFTTDNPHLNQDAIAAQAKKWSRETQEVRLYGKNLRFSNRIHPLFASQDQTWCFTCQNTCIPTPDGGIITCGTCGSKDLEKFCHVQDFDTPRYPVIWALDPHPRKPHMSAWFAVTPYDDVLQVAEDICEGDPTEVHERTLAVEQDLGLMVAKRICDPNMGRSPSSSTRGVTWQDEFAQAGLICDLADDSDVGRGRLNQFLKPDPHTREPRVKIHSRCTETIRQLMRYRWDEHKQRLEKDVKQTPKAVADDFPTLWKYVMNLEPTFNWLRSGPQVIRRRR
jgi:hypothetical protein